MILPTQYPSDVIDHSKGILMRSEFRIIMMEITFKLV